jgi:hypothetical protein
MSVKMARSTGSPFDCDLLSPPTKLLIVIFVVEVGFGAACEAVFSVDVLEMLESSSVVAETFETTELMVLRSIFSGRASSSGSCLVCASKSE